ncbi:MAG: tRNA pseudouridine(54/55) synthase Pus10 [Candidatus Bathyarchaeia archaeon]
MDVLEKSQKMLEKYPLCDNCLGRQFALLGFGVDNKSRGEAIKLLLLLNAHASALSKEKAGIALLKQLATNGALDAAAEVLKRLKKRSGNKKQCYLCQNHFELVDELVTLALDSLGDYEFSTFLVGVELPREIEEKEDEFRAEFEISHGESMRSEFSRLLGREIAEKTQKNVEYRNPDITLLMNPFTKQIKVQINPLYIAGRYKKLVRGIPQSKWHCKECRGKGCERCNWTGKMYPESVEELIAKPLIEETGGTEVAFHAAGREDIDARMLGEGRPFIIEVKKPRKRFIDLTKLTRLINGYAEGKVEVAGLRLASKDDARKLKKGEAAEKRYRVIVEFDRNVSDEELVKLEEVLSGITIRQRTPFRVLHRRADKIREKHIYETNIKRVSPNRVEMTIRCQGGLYIKELITGDEGRTEPNVCQILGAHATPVELDVLGVDMEE